LSRTERIEVYTDGQCPLCRWTRARVEPFDRDRRIEWIDLNDPEAQRRAAPHTFAELTEEMHVRRPDGSWSKGFWSWLDVLRVLPRWRWTVRVLSLWPLTSLGPIFYRWLARRRYSLLGIPPPCAPDGVCSLHKK
jgi:predicted DCC family thiol-disulfide oxidoreductase YuxK